MNISKQKRNLIFELSYLILKDIEKLNDNTELKTLYKKTNIKTLTNVVKSSYYHTNKEIKQLISILNLNRSNILNTKQLNK